MSSKNAHENKNSKFNGEGVDDFEDFAEKLHIEAAKRGCDQHFNWKPEDVDEEGFVPEEVFRGVRPCEPGQEEAVCLERKQESLNRLEAKNLIQVQAVTAGYRQLDERNKKLTDLALKLSDEVDKVEDGFQKTIHEMRAACDLYDRNLKLFQDHRAGAVSLLTHWMGPNPTNMTRVVLKDHGPKNAWKVLVDAYLSEAGTAMYLNTVTQKMSSMVFSKKTGAGKAVDHMASLEQYNATLKRHGAGCSDMQLMNYLFQAIKRNPAANAFYKDAIKTILYNQKSRKEGMALFAYIENEKTSESELVGERVGPNGAQFVEAKAHTGTAQVKKGKGNKRKHDGGKESGGAESNKKKAAGGGKLFCTRCGGEHKRHTCEGPVFCKHCNVDTHAEKCCFKLHPELMPDFMKKHKVGKRN